MATLKKPAKEKMTNSTNSADFEKKVYVFDDNVNWQWEAYDDIREFDHDTNWDEAVKWAYENDFHLRLFYKRDGGEWKDMGATDKPIEPQPEDFGADAHFEEKTDGFDCLLDNAEELARNAHTISELIEQLQYLKEIEDELNRASDDEWVFCYAGTFVERILKRTTFHNYDVHTYQIVAVK